MGPEVLPAPPLRLTEAQVSDDVDLVVLFGSRARGHAHPSSHWDVGVRFHRPHQPLLHLCALDPVLARAIGCSSDAIDVVELAQERANLLP
ncbi:MAG: nucleotidyltransferase domain-containing protein [Cyanobacteriota bacterium]